MLALAGLALGVRLVVVLVIHLMTLHAHLVGVWLDDEAGVYQAT